MAGGGEPPTSDERVRRSASRSLANALLLLALLGGLGVWAWLGGASYTLQPGQAAIVLRLGKHVDTVSQPGLRWHWPAPFETHDVVAVEAVGREAFGFRGADVESAEAGPAALEATMQTRENNIVRLSFEVQYKIKDAFAARFRLANPEATLRDAAQSAIREVVGSSAIEGVLSEDRGLIGDDTRKKLQEILDSYGAGLAIQGVQLKDAQPPAPVRAAFDDVIAAQQDASRAVNEARGFSNEVLPRARAEAAELSEAANAYRQSVVAEATGAAARFSAVAAEHRKAPRVTEKRLYLEAMESVLPGVEKVIIEPGLTSVVPYLPLRRAGDGGGEKAR
jgi:membrane protease subunit HflK